jgi:hypothetical protein
VANSSVHLDNRIGTSENRSKDTGTKSAPRRRSIHSGATMGERELREKYGGKLAKAINRAIRAELPGGNAALDKLTELAGPAMQSGWKARNGDPTPEAVLYFKHKRGVVEKLEAEIRSRWQIPQEDSAPTKPRRQRSSHVNQADRKPAKAYRRGPRKGK